LIIKELEMKKLFILSVFFAFFATSINGDEQYVAQYTIIPSFNNPQEYKSYVDKAVITQNIDPLIDLLISEDEKHQELRKNYPFAMKLYKILDNKTIAEDFAAEKQYIPLQIITDVTRRLAIEGDNDQFLENMPQ
jgi:hypothetical protein